MPERTAYKAAPAWDPAVTPDLPPEERGRAELYQFLAVLLSRPPTNEIIALLEHHEPDGSEVGRAMARLADHARQLGRAPIAQEFADLFVGAPAPRLMPYASYYRDGHLFGHTLADLRAELSALGIARENDTSEPEDHLATLSEVMAGLILGAFSAPAPLDEQKAFFDRYLGSWADEFLDDLDEAEGARFYRAFGDLARVFLRLEGEAFRMVGR